MQSPKPVNTVSKEGIALFTYRLKSVDRMSVARNQDIFIHTKEEEDLEAEWEIFRGVLDRAISDYNGMREREGERIGADISAKIESIRQMTLDSCHRASCC